jgi:hypothetical protein
MYSRQLAVSFQIFSYSLFLFILQVHLTAQTIHMDVKRAENQEPHNDCESPTISFSNVQIPLLIFTLQRW